MPPLQNRAEKGGPYLMLTCRRMRYTEEKPLFHSFPTLRAFDVGESNPPSTCAETAGFVGVRRS